jgi:hypothetical protein
MFFRRMNARAAATTGAARGGIGALSPDELSSLGAHERAVFAAAASAAAAAAAAVAANATSLTAIAALKRRNVELEEANALLRARVAAAEAGTVERLRRSFFTRSTVVLAGVMAWAFTSSPDVASDVGRIGPAASDEAAHDASLVRSDPPDAEQQLLPQNVDTGVDIFSLRGIAGGDVTEVGPRRFSATFAVDDASTTGQPWDEPQCPEGVFLEREDALGVVEMHLVVDVATPQL